MESRKSVFLLHSVLYIWFPLTRVLTYTFIGVSARPADNLRNYRGCRGYGDLSEQYPESQRRSSRRMVGDLPRHANHCTPSRDVREVFSEQQTNEISNPVKDSVSAVNRKAAMHYNRQGNGGCNPRVGRSCDTKHVSGAVHPQNRGRRRTIKSSSPRPEAALPHRSQRHDIMRSARDKGWRARTER
jgi:hypothetical protein